MVIKYVIIFTLAGIVLSLGYGMFFMLKDKSGSNRAVKALTVRIVLSVTLFLAIIIGFITGAIQPHGLMPTAPAQQSQ